MIERGDGTPRDPDTVTHRFAGFAEAAGVSGVRFHDLRHAYATTLLKQNVNPKIVSEALGHASVAFTMDTYSHVLPSMQDQAAEAIGKALNLWLAMPPRNTRATSQPRTIRLSGRHRARSLT